MWFAIKRLSLGVSLITMMSAILLISDLSHRKPRARHIPRVAILQFASRPTLDEGVRGMLDGLTEHGFVTGKTIDIQRFNAENDLPTTNAIAKETTDGRFDMVLSASTPCLQAVANANEAGRTIHVFGLVTDPFGAGVGISRNDPLDHPRHLVGVGTFQPVDETFRLAKRLFPALKSVGVVWNPAEACSEACTMKARAITKELGIKLVEATVDNTSAVREAAISLFQRGVEAIWVGGDNTVEMAIDAVVDAARKAGIPVFANNPDLVEAGALFALGANYYEVGRTTGTLAAKILVGTDPATIPIENVVPQRLALNKKASVGLKDHWQFPKDILANADMVIDETGMHEKAETIPRPPVGRIYKIGVVYFGPDPATESGLEGFLDGLAELGFEQGENLQAHIAHAQGEIANIPPILQNYQNQQLDLIVPLTTPCLTAACGLVKKTPVVFTVVYDPIAAGAGKSRSDHLSNFTGVGSFPPIEETMDVIQQVMPGVKSIGTLYNSSEANSRKAVSIGREILVQRGIKLEEVTITNSSEVYQAAQALTNRNIQAMWITGDNTALQAFESIVKAVNEVRLPLIINDPDFVERGALLAVGFSFYHSGHAGSDLAGRVLLGENPEEIPIKEVAVREVVLNFDVAKRLGITFPQELIQEATSGNERQEVPKIRKTIDMLARPAKKWRLRLVHFVDAPFSEGSEKGIMAGLAENGLVEGRDFEIAVRSAQGDVATLNSIIDAIVTESVDLILLTATPTLQVALNRVHDLPIVFTAVANPVLAGAGRSTNDHLPNVTGIHTMSDFDGMVEVLRECLPSARRIGTVFVPAEVNSVYYKDAFQAAARNKGIDLLAEAANTSSEVPDAALSLCSKEIDVVCQISDNLTASSFASIVQAARRLKVPLFAFVSEQARTGAAVAVARDFEQGGKDAASLAVRIMRGESPGSIPFQPVSKTRIVVNLQAARILAFDIPASLIERADEVIR